MRNVRKKDFNKIADIYGQITEIVSPSLRLGTGLINQVSNILLTETASQNYGYGTDKIIKNSLGNIDTILELNNNELASPGNGMLPGEEIEPIDPNLGDPLPYDPYELPIGEEPRERDRQNNICFIDRVSRGLNPLTFKRIHFGQGIKTILYAHGRYVPGPIGFCIGEWIETSEGSSFRAIDWETAQALESEAASLLEASNGATGHFRKTVGSAPAAADFVSNFSENYNAANTQNRLAEAINDLTSNSGWPVPAFADLTSASFFYISGAGTCASGYFSGPNGNSAPPFVVRVENDGGNGRLGVDFNPKIDYCSRDTPITFTTKNNGNGGNQPIPFKKCRCKKGKKKMNCGCSCREIADIMARYLSRVKNNHEQTRDKHTGDVEKLGQFLQQQIVQTAPTQQDFQPDLSPILEKINYLISLLSKLDEIKENTGKEIDLTPILQRLNEVEAFLWTGVKPNG